MSRRDMTDEEWDIADFYRHRFDDEGREPEPEDRDEQDADEEIER